MSDFRRTYQIQISPTAPAPDIAGLVQEHCSGAMAFDRVEIKRGSEILAFGTFGTLSCRKTPASVLESE
jgi:hypothetical protein